MHALRCARPARHGTNAWNANKIAGLLGQGDRINRVSGSACFLLFLALRLAVSSQPQHPVSDQHSESASPFSQNLLRRLSVVQWVTFNERVWVNADERQGPQADWYRQSALSAAECRGLIPDFAVAEPTAA
jgi:hypothetical protein